MGWYLPPGGLTSIDMNRVALGQEAGRRIIRMIAGEQFSGIERLPCSWVQRDSSGPDLHNLPQTG